MKRRAFIGLIGGAVAWPVVVRAQQPGGAKRVAVLMGSAENDPVAQARVGLFKKGLAENGWIENRNLRVEVRWGGGDAARAQALARDLVGLAPDVILGTNTPT